MDIAWTLQTENVTPILDRIPSVPLSGSVVSVIRSFSSGSWNTFFRSDSTNNFIFYAFFSCLYVCASRKNCRKYRTYLEPCCIKLKTLKIIPNYVQI